MLFLDFMLVSNDLKQTFLYNFFIFYLIIINISCPLFFLFSFLFFFYTNQSKLWKHTEVTVQPYTIGMIFATWLSDFDVNDFSTCELREHQNLPKDCDNAACSSALHLNRVTKQSVKKCLHSTTLTFGIHLPDARKLCDIYAFGRKVWFIQFPLGQNPVSVCLKNFPFTIFPFL